jgi:K+-sensing histidine kinase KdpD
LKFKEKEITFNVDASPEIRQKRIMVDPVLFESTVMNNLISNAVKFSYAKSSIWLRVTEENKKIST